MTDALGCLYCNSLSALESRKTPQSGMHSKDSLGNMRATVEAAVFLEKGY